MKISFQVLFTLLCHGVTPDYGTQILKVSNELKKNVFWQNEIEIWLNIFGYSFECLVKI